MLDHLPRGLSRGKMGIVQDPDPHPPALCLLQDDVHIVPPARPCKVGMGPGLQAHLVDIGILNHSHVFAQYLFRFPMLPEKRQDIISRLVLQRLLQSPVHRFHAPPLYSIYYYIGGHGLRKEIILLKTRKILSSALHLPGNSKSRKAAFPKSL